jgi:hypothetical protein
MMKCKFLPVLVTALMMFIGVSMFAQNYVPNAEALNRANKELTTLYQGASDITVSNVNPESSSQAYDAEVLKSLKIQFAKELIVNLNQGTATGEALTTTNSILAGGSSDAGYVGALRTTVLYFENLLK